LLTGGSGGNAFTCCGSTMTKLFPKLPLDAQASLPAEQNV
jgi:hypothetical protein